MGIGSQFMALDGDSAVRGALEQNITGLVNGQTYTLTFDWAADQLADRSGTTTESLLVSLGSHSQSTVTLTQLSDTASLWYAVTMHFTATDGPNEVLSFLSMGTPDGQPPMALLDNVSLTNGVPEPATWGLMLVGVAAVGASLRMRRRAAATLA